MGENEKRYWEWSSQGKGNGSRKAGGEFGRDRQDHQIEEWGEERGQRGNAVQPHLLISRGFSSKLSEDTGLLGAENATRTPPLTGVETTVIYLFIWPCLPQVEFPGPGIEPVSQQWRELLQGLRQVLNSLSHQGTPDYSNFIVNTAPSWLTHEVVRRTAYEKEFWDFK